MAAVLRLIFEQGYTKIYLVNIKAPAANGIGIELFAKTIQRLQCKHNIHMKIVNDHQSFFCMSSFQAQKFSSEQRLARLWCEA